MIRAASDIQECPVAWASPRRLAFGHLAILDGDPGLGKSILSLDLAARLSRGWGLFGMSEKGSDPLPGDDHVAGEKPGGLSPFQPTPVSSVIFAAEDSLPETTVPRLRALGADLSRVHCWEQEPNKPFCLPHDIPLLAESIRSVDARLVVLDPIVCFLGRNVQLYNDQSVRGALQPLVDLARITGAIILLLRHLNKANRQKALYRGAGSIGFTAACRFGYALVRDPQDSQGSLLIQVKNNLSAPAPPLPVRVSRQADGVALVWGKERTPGPDELALAASLKPSKFQLARELLLGLLGQGSVDAEEIWAAAQRLDLSVRTINAAKASLNIVTERRVVEGGMRSWWSLPAGSSERDPNTPVPDPESLDAFLADFARRYPENGPLAKDYLP